MISKMILVFVINNASANGLDTVSFLSKARQKCYASQVWLNRVWTHEHESWTVHWNAVVSFFSFFFFYHSFIVHRLKNRTRPISTLQGGRRWWDSNLCTPACESRAVVLTTESSLYSDYYTITIPLLYHYFHENLLSSNNIITEN